MMFYIKRIDEPIFARIKGKSYKSDCTVPVDDLRYLHILHKDLERQTHEGELICNAYISADLLYIFQRLYEAAYPIERVRLIDEYGADDETSMLANNSSCFNFRLISHTTNVSKHGLGLAVDINPLYNPYIKEVDGKRVLEPATAEEYIDRSKVFPYKIEEDDLCCKLFAERGFEWGGNCWDNRKDYQHFAIPDEVVARLYKFNI